MVEDVQSSESRKPLAWPQCNSLVAYDCGDGMGCIPCFVCRCARASRPWLWSGQDFGPPSGRVRHVALGKSQITAKHKGNDSWNDRSASVDRRRGRVVEEKTPVRLCTK